MARRFTSAFSNAVPLVRSAHETRPRALCTMRASPLGVVITGSTAGLGLALAENFLRSGAHVVVNSRRAESVNLAMNHLQSLDVPNSTNMVHGYAGDVSVPEDVENLFNSAAQVLPSLDILICNAGSSAIRKPLAEVPAEEIVEGINATFTGAILTARKGMSMNFKHVWFVEGAGSDGLPTPNMAVYGACKRGLGFLVKSIQREKGDSTSVIHVLSPGMMLSYLLLKNGTSEWGRRIFNALAEEPRTVADYLVPKILAVHDSDAKKGTAVRYLTIPSAIPRLLARFVLGWRKNRFFLEDTGERIDGDGADFDELGVRRMMRTTLTPSTSATTLPPEESSVREPTAGRNN